MYKHGDKSNAKQGGSKSSPVSQRKSSRKFDAGSNEPQCVENSSKAQQAAQLQAVADNFVDKKAIQQVANQPAPEGDQSESIQLAKKTGVKSKRKRPSFSGPARKLRQNTDSNDDLAHRISYDNIAKIVDGGDKSKITKLIKKVTIPQRKFGKYKKGDTTYFDKVQKISDDEELIKALNNSPFNLRPGNASINRSIGSSFDPNVDDNGYDTDQTESLRPFALSEDTQNRTSSYLPDNELGDWEDEVFDKKKF
jgi:hypothetical protein